MTERPVLLYVIADASRTGAPRQVSYLVAQMSDQYRVHLACPEGWLAEDARKHDATVHTFDNYGSVLAVRNQLRDIYAKVHPDIIHCHGVRGGVAGRLANWGKAAMVYTEHRWTADFHLPSALREKVQLAVLKYVGRKTDHTVAVSHAVEQFLLSRGIAQKSKCSVIYGAVESLGQVEPVKEPFIGTLGRLTWVKGVDTLLQALPAVTEGFPDCRCRIAGDGPDKAALQARAQALGVDDHIDWLGEVHDPQAFFGTLQVYVHPAITESFGLAPLEAMSAGLPTIASRGGALPEIIDENVDGLLFPVGDEKACARDLIRLLSDASLRGRIAEAGKKRARHFDVAKLAAHHHKLYQGLH